MADWIDEVRAAAAAALPPTEGELAVLGLREAVEVRRDRWGVAYIRAENLDDLFFAQGYVVASERLFQIDLALRAANGRLSTLFGELTLPLDRFARTVGWNCAGAKVAAGYDEESQRMTAAYRSGVRAWARDMPAPPVEFALLGGQPPWVPDDERAWAAALVYVAWSLSGNWMEELIREEIAASLGPEAVRALYPALPSDPPDVLAGKRGGDWRLGLLEAAPPRTPGAGSNSWVVSGARTASGKPLLAGDPHLEPQQPGAWFECHLSAPGYEARGVCLPFVPGVIIGHTADHAWGFTNVTGDTQDLFVERLNPDGTAALFRGEWEPLTVHVEEIAVRDREEPERLKVRESRHGPILDAYLVGELNPDIVEGGLREPYALRWTGHEHAIRPSAVLHAAQAASFEEFREALRGIGCPGQNVMYADVDGVIGYQTTGLFPIRPAGDDGSLPVPGWTGEHEWEGFIPFEELPWARNPDEGYLVTANNRVVDESYPYHLGVDFHTPHRARRIVELLNAEKLHTVDSFARIQADTVSLPSRRLVPRLLEVRPEGERQDGALKLLASWDGDLAADSAAAALFQTWSRHLATAIAGTRLGPELFDRYYAWREPFQCLALPELLEHPTAEWFGEVGSESPERALRTALDAALDELTGTFGPDPGDWGWGRLHRVTMAGPLARMPGFDTLFTAADLGMGGDEQTVLNAGFDAREGFRVSVVPSWRAVIDLADVDASVGVLPTGQSGNPASPHWNDQTPLWTAGELRALPFTPAAVESAAVSTLRLLPGYHR